MERSSVWKPNVEISPNCPRCGCSNTKFCYYNNYSLTQPRYFCKGCRRYWTKGGSLRNVPVGGGCRKNRRGRSLRLSSAAADGGLHSKNSGFRSTTGVDPIGNSYHGVNSSGNSTYLADHSTRSSSGSHIDLALVYANFLNPKPDCKSGAITNIGSEIPELGSHDRHNFDPSLEFSSISTPDHMTGGGSSVQMLPQIPELSTENCCDGNKRIYLCGLDSFHKHHQDRSDHHENCAIHTDFVLPPLPGQELLWSSAQTMQAATQLVPAMIEPLDHLKTHQDHDNLLSNWILFDLPSDDTFPGGSMDEKI